MTLRLKLLLPLALVWTAFIAYLYGIWLPDSVRYQIAVFERQQEREMHNLTESLLPLVVARQLGDIHDTLDSLRQENPEWVEVVLQDHEGRQLYPLAGTPVPPAGPDEQLHTQQLNLANDSVGSLRIRISHRALLESVAQSQKTLFALLASVLLGAFLALGVVLDATVRRPVNRLMTAARELAEGRFDAHLPPGGKDEIGTLVNTFAAMRDQVQATQQSLRQLNEHLEQRVQEELAKNREKDHMLIQQSRLAAMGEMVHNIAHQWRQPLNALGLVIANIRDDFAFGQLDAAALDESVGRALKLLQRMSTTIDDFRNFFRPDRDPADFDLGAAVEDAAFIMEASLKNNDIALERAIEPDLRAWGFHGQFSQAVLNVLANAKEVLQERHVRPARIRLQVSRCDGQVEVTVEDNAGGIPGNVLGHIFEPYFTTKEQGSGIGLYMTKMILERSMHGKIRAENTAEGARFVLTVPLYTLPPTAPMQ